MPTDHARVEYQVFTKLAPEAYGALTTLGKTVGAAGLDQELTELVKLRVSQINGCAFCVQYHLNVARRLSVVAVKLDLVAAWRDAGVFSAREAAALAWAEHLTRLAADAAPEHARDAVREHFSETETVFLTIAIGTINAWNRLGVGLGFAPLPPREAAA